MRFTLKIISLLSILLVAACAPKTNNKTSGKDSSSSVVLPSDNSTKAAIDSIYEGIYDIPIYFGFNNVRSSFEEDIIKVPVISGLTFKTTGRHHVGVKCPDNPYLLGWVDQQLKKFIIWSQTGKHPSEQGGEEIPYKSYTSPSVQVDNCIARLGGRIPIPGELEDPIEQFAILITDVCSVGDYYTMQRDDWYDYSSCGNNTTKEWFSINTKTGKVIGMDDLFATDGDDASKLLAILIKHLVGYEGLWKDGVTDYTTEILHKADGCALLSDSVLIFYDPYTIGCGADGRFTAKIPISELNGLLKLKW